MTGKTLWYRSAAIAGIAVTGAFLLMEGPGSPEVVVLPGVSEVVPEGRAAMPSGDPAADGIKVHGHWTIEVREPDGRVVTRREFENALVAEGAAFLAEFLVGANFVEAWEVYLAGPSSPCRSWNPSGRIGCRIVTEDIYGGEGDTFSNLVLSVESSSVATLTGEAVASQAGDIVEVSTFVFPVLGNDRGIQFTSTSIDPISVVDGQVIIATVRITFH